MPPYQFRLVIPTGSLTETNILDTVDELGNAGCTDAAIGGAGRGH